MAQKSKLAKILPTSFELVSFLLLAALILLLGNSYQMLNYFGLEQSGETLHASAGNAVTAGLSKLDNFAFTSQVVTFLIWAIVGVFCFSIVRGIAHMYSEVKFDNDLSSSRYVHPATFTKARFWKRVGMDFAVLVAALSLTVAVLYGLLAYLLPVSLAYTRSFVLGMTPGSTVELFAGFALVYVWLVVVDMCLRTVYHHRQLTLA